MIKYSLNGLKSRLENVENIYELEDRSIETKKTEAQIENSLNKMNRASVTCEKISSSLTYV